MSNIATLSRRKTLTSNTSSRPIAVRKTKKRHSGDIVSYDRNFVKSVFNDLKELRYKDGENEGEYKPEFESNGVKYKLLSNPSESMSGSIVYLYTNKGRNYILKLTSPILLMDTTKNNIEGAIVEYQIYNYINILYLLNITQHVILSYGGSVLTIGDLKHKFIKANINIFYNKLPEGVNLTNFNSLFMMLNETTIKDEKIINLLNFIEETLNDDAIKNNPEKLDILMYKVIPNLLFQIIYTLDCFYRLKIKHNDLHLGNILIYINPKNILNTPNYSDKYNKYNKYVVSHNNYYFGPNIDEFKEYFKMKNTYKGVNTYLVPDLGFSVRLFDFDNSTVYDFDNNIIVDFNYKYTRSFDFEGINYKGRINSEFNNFPTTMNDIYNVLNNMYYMLYVNKYLPSGKDKEYKDYIVNILENIFELRNNDTGLNIKEFVEIRNTNITIDGKNNNIKCVDLTHYKYYIKEKNFMPYDLIYNRNYLDLFKTNPDDEDKTEILINPEQLVDDSKIINTYLTDNIDHYWNGNLQFAIERIIKERNQKGKNENKFKVMKEACKLLLNPKVRSKPNIYDIKLLREIEPIELINPKGRSVAKVFANIDYHKQTEYLSSSNNNNNATEV